MVKEKKYKTREDLIKEYRENYSQEYILKLELNFKQFTMFQKGPELLVEAILEITKWAEDNKGTAAEGKFKKIVKKLNYVFNFVQDLKVVQERNNYLESTISMLNTALALSNSDLQEYKAIEAMEDEGTLETKIETIRKRKKRRHR